METDDPTVWAVELPDANPEARDREIERLRRAGLRIRSVEPADRGWRILVHNRRQGQHLVFFRRRDSD